MIKEEFEKNLSSIQEKLGNEEHGKIVGELSILTKANEESNSRIAELEKQVADEKAKNNQYIEANAILMQQIGTKPETPPTTPGQPQKDEKKDGIEWNECFDKKGNFIK